MRSLVDIEEVMGKRSVYCVFMNVRVFISHVLWDIPFPKFKHAAHAYRVHNHAMEIASGCRINSHFRPLANIQRVHLFVHSRKPRA